MDREKPLNVHEAKAQFSELLDRAHAGQEIIVSKKGKPWAKIVPIVASKKREFGFARGAVDASFFDALPDAELDAWEGILAQKRVASATKGRKRARAAVSRNARK
jgi:prevent-host-death family protein